MALSQQVSEAIKEAEGALRNALYWAAKNEKTTSIFQISKILTELEQVEKMDQFADKLEEIQNQLKKKGGGDMFGTFF